MKISIISFTQNGIKLSEKISRIFKEGECILYTKCSLYQNNAQNVNFADKSISEWAGEQFEKRRAMLFIGACAIAVRAIAPHISDKLSDSPVIVIDEKGQYVIPVLSGHIGGANELAVFIANKLQAQPVITTATDINDKFSIDVFAKKNNLSIVNKNGIAKVSAKVLAGEDITISIENGHISGRAAGHAGRNGKIADRVYITDYPPSEPVDVLITSKAAAFLNKETADKNIMEIKSMASLVLIPREYAIGMGCTKGKKTKEIEAFIMENLEKANLELSQVAGLASIDVKKNERGFIEWSVKENIPFITYTADELKSVEGDFNTSDFVNDVVGVDNVCERAALKFCGDNGRLVYEKHAKDGMTIAIAKADWRVDFNEK